MGPHIAGKAISRNRSSEETSEPHRACSGWHWREETGHRAANLGTRQPSKGRLPPPSPVECTPCSRSASSSTGKIGPSPSTAQHRSRLARLDHHRRNPLRPRGYGNGRWLPPARWPAAI